VRGSGTAVHSGRPLAQAIGGRIERPTSPQAVTQYLYRGSKIPNPVIGEKSPLPWETGTAGSASEANPLGGGRRQAPWAFCHYDMQGTAQAYTLKHDSSAIT
jgi:hypothetical protein